MSDTNQSLEPLVSEAMLQDPDFLTARDSMMTVLKKHSAKLTKISPPRPERVEAYEDLLAAFGAIRSGNLYYPFIGSGAGNGPFVELTDGSVKLDFINGIGVHHFGHAHPALVEAAVTASMGDVVMQGNLQQNELSYDFSKKLLEAANTQGAGFDHCFLSSTGVMAGENSLKIAMQKKHPAHRVLAFDRCFAGRTHTFSQITDKPGFRVGIPKTLSVDYVPFFDASRPDESTSEAVATLRKHLLRYPGEYGAMIFELVQGEGGFNTAPPAFHRALMEVCKEHNVAVLIDEVQTFARTPSPFAYQHLGLDDMIDVVWIGKASQVCATLFRHDFAPKPGLLSQTFTASSTALSAGMAILEELIDGGYFGPEGKIVRMHDYFAAKLEALHQKHPDLVSGPYGIGAMVAFTPFDGDGPRATALAKKLFAGGLMGFIAGANPTRMRFLLPIGAVQEEHIDIAAEMIEQTLLDMKENQA